MVKNGKYGIVDNWQSGSLENGIWQRGTFRVRTVRYEKALCEK